MNYLQPYKGKDTRHDCPSCKAKLSFTQYLDGNTHKPIHDIVGKCNRESKCGYHYTPKQYFMDNPSHVETRHASSEKSIQVNKKVSPSQPPGTIHFSFVQKSASYRSNFVRFLCEFFSTEQISYIGDNYALGATKTKEVIFWQIDIHGKVRTGKIMQYNPTTGKRLKHQSGAIDWVHNKLKKSKELPEDFNLQQCFFGEHLLKIYPNKQVAIVESEKSAIIASCIVPDLIWLAAGNLNGLSVEKCHVLKGRDVILYPDLGAYEKWIEKAKQIENSIFLPSKNFTSAFPSPFGEGVTPNGWTGEVREGYRVRCSTLLEDEANDIDRANGFDIADYIITELKFHLSKTNNTNFPLPMERVSEGQERLRGFRGDVIPQIQSCFSPTLQSMIEKNKILLNLIDKLELVEI